MNMNFENWQIVFKLSYRGSVIPLKSPEIFFNP